jgi:hypothetical protein
VRRLRAPVLPRRLDRCRSLGPWPKCQGSRSDRVRPGLDSADVARTIEHRGDGTRPATDPSHLRRATRVIRGQADPERRTRSVRAPESARQQFYLLGCYRMLHDVAMTNWEYSELFDGYGASSWAGPDGVRETRKVSFIVWLNELGQDGWGLAGYARGASDGNGYASCLLKRAVE